MAQTMMYQAYIVKKFVHGPHNDVPSIQYIVKKFIQGPHNDVPSIYSEKIDTWPTQ